MPANAVVRRFVAGLRGEGAVRLADLGSTARARAVLGRLADGQTREAIAAAEGVSPATVKRIVAELEAKLDVPNQFVLAVRATQLGLIR